MPPKFEIGRLVYTPGARDVLLANNIDPLELVKRHINGDWGDTLPDDKKENDYSIDKYLRIWSTYIVGGVRVGIITEADRSATTILLNSEY